MSNSEASRYIRSMSVRVAPWLIVFGSAGVFLVFSLVISTDLGAIGIGVVCVELIICAWLFIEGLRYLHSCRNSADTPAGLAVFGATSPVHNPRRSNRNSGTVGLSRLEPISKF